MNDRLTPQQTRAVLAHERQARRRELARAARAVTVEADSVGDAAEEGRDVHLRSLRHRMGQLEFANKRFLRADDYLRGYEASVVDAEEEELNRLLDGLGVRDLEVQMVRVEDEDLLSPEVEQKVRDLRRAAELADSRGYADHVSRGLRAEADRLEETLDGGALTRAEPAADPAGA